MTDLYKIEKGVPVVLPRFRRWKQLAEKMSVGDSVLVANDNEATGAVMALKQRGFKVVRRKQLDDTVRVHVLAQEKK